MTDATGNVTFDFPSGFFSMKPCISAEIANADPTKFYNRLVTTWTKDRVVVAVRSYVVALGILNLTLPAAGLEVTLIARRPSAA